jgi:DNA-binding transcriptional LysR family regulator
MEMHQVRYFLAVARTLNFTRAAEECNVTQPSLTRAIQKLEEEFDGLLFRRERALTHLTDLGRQMLPHLERTFEAAQAAKALARGIGKVQVASLTLGLAQSIKSPQVAAVLGEVGAGLPGFQLTLNLGPSGELLQSAIRGELDLIIVERPDESPERLDEWELYDQRYVVVVRSDHRFAALDGVAIADLHGEPLIERTNEPNLSFKAACAAAGAEPIIRHRVPDDEQLHRLAEAGLGACLLPDGMKLGNGLVARAISGAELKRIVILGSIGGRQRPPAAEAFIRAARARSWEPMPA